jgi:sugar phosphate isomerase/epimerase
MGRPVTLFTGQWADLPLEDLAKKARQEFGYDGLELACWGDHFEPSKVLDDEGYFAKRGEILTKYSLQCHAISNHLVGQAVCDLIDERHKAILPAHVWGDGDPRGVNVRAAEEMKQTARAAQKFSIPVVNGFTGSSIWHLVYSFPPVPEKMIEEGFQLFADRWHPILDVFGECGVKFALEVHPTEIAFDPVTAQCALDAIDNRDEFGFNFDPSHLL